MGFSIPVPDIEMCFGQVATIVGTNGSNTINGTAGNDVIAGRGGNDVINGGGGDDLICGGDGSDTINGGVGSDALIAERGNDTVRGGDGNDSILGGNGNDILLGEGGNDVIDGQAGNDTLNGAAGDDRLYGGTGDDTIRGAVGHDIVNGGSGDDILLGGGGNDTMRGGVGHDKAYGSDGNDTILGGGGNDFLRGDTGNDRPLRLRRNRRLQGRCRCRRVLHSAARLRNSVEHSLTSGHSHHHVLGVPVAMTGTPLHAHHSIRKHELMTQETRPRTRRTRRWLTTALAALLSIPLTTSLISTQAAATDNDAEVYRATFGGEPLDVIIGAATIATDGPENTLWASADRLAALMLTPVWAEITDHMTNLTPAPMALSRYDNQLGLHSFRSRNSFRSAFWHPGIGLWQMDSAGIGAPFSADERIDVAVMAPVVADEMLSTLCSSGSTTSGCRGWPADRASAYPSTTRSLMAPRCDPSCRT